MSNLDLAKVENRLRELKERYELLKNWQSLTKEEFLQEPMKNRAVLRVLQEAIECCISMAHQIVAEQGYGKPAAHADAFLLLSQHRVIDEEFAGELKKMVDFRNLITHRYWDVDLEKVWEIFQARVEDFKRFGQEILRFIQRLPE